MSADFTDLWSGLGGAASWSFGDGASATGTQVSHTYSSPGNYTVTVTASDSLGNQTTATYSIAVTAPAPPPPHGELRLTGVSQSRPEWSEAKKRLHNHKRHAPVGTTFRFTLNHAATVTLKFTRATTGRRASHTCVHVTRNNRHSPHCSLRTTPGVVVIAGHSGQNRMQFNGLLRPHRKLAPGRYTVLITASNPTGSAASTLSFTIV
jgi:PKD repeat protein